MTAQALDVSVVVCTWSSERWDTLVAAVESVRRQTVQPRETVVVVDHNAHLLERVRMQLPDVVAVASSAERLGISGTRNSGVLASEGEIIAFLDDDAVAEPNWLAELCAGLQDPRVLGVGGAVEPLWKGARPCWFPEELDWVVGCTFRGMPDTVQPVQRVISCNMAFPKSVYAEIGGFRHGIGRVGGIPVAGEETEFCIRARQRWPHKYWLYNANARVHHVVPAHRMSWRYFRRRCYAEGISKALIARQVGTQDGLEVERQYVTRTLPRAITRNLREGARRRDPARLARAASVVAGLVTVTSGYVVGTVLTWRGRAGR